MMRAIITITYISRFYRAIPYFFIIFLFGRLCATAFACDTRVYWIEESPTWAIRRSFLDGSNAETIITGAESYGQYSDIYVDCDANKIYYAIDAINYIYSANLDGSNRQIMVSAASHPTGIGIDKINGKIYWTEASNGLIRRSNMDGSGAETILSSLNEPVDIAVDMVNGKIYYSDGWTDGLYRAGLDGSSHTLMYSGAPSPAGIALDLDNNYIYWAKGVADGIGRANLDGSSPTNLLSVTYPYGICLDPAAGKIYYSAASYIGRANMDGSNAESLVAADPDAIAIGAYSYMISGTVFEDADFDGTAAAYGSGDKLLANVDVELYSSNDVYLASTKTDGSGAYHFDGLINGATYKVRVRTATIGDSDTPPAAGFNSGFTSARAEVTWAHGSPLYGGQSPTTDDTSTGDNAGPGDAYVSVTINSADVTNVIFGVAYNLIVNTNNNGQGSLRRFINNANAIAGAQTSQFRIPTSDPNYSGTGNGEFTISPTSAFPNISDRINLDGSTQTTNIGNTNSNGPEIELNGAGAGYARGIILHSNSDGSTVQDMVINRFSGKGIHIYYSHGNAIQGNYIGPDVTGLIDRGNGEVGIHLEGSSNNTIGGTNAGDANYIGGNGLAGMLLYPASNNNTIQGNYIGVGTDLVTALGNGDAGICIPDSYNNVIGGTVAAAANIIAYNPDGIHTSDASDNNAFLHNSIYANTDLGIDHNENGVTANDAGDSDSGPNDLLNFPVINSAAVSTGTVTVNCELDAPAGSYRIEFFTNASGADPSGYGEGQTFVAYTNITHPGGGTYSFTDSFSGGAGDIITATATECTDGAACATFGSTSEFSATATSVNAPNIGIAKSVSVISDPFNGTFNPKMIPGAVIECTLTITNQGLSAVDADTLALTDPLDSNTALYVNDLGGSGSGPVAFADGSPVSGLTYTFTSLSSTTDNIAFSNDNGSSFTYTPVPDGDGYDGTVTHLRLMPKGSFNASDGSNHPNFSIVFRIKVD